MAIIIVSAVRLLIDHILDIGIATSRIRSTADADDGRMGWLASGGLDRTVKVRCQESAKCFLH